jgi:hypothetical protein
MAAVMMPESGSVREARVIEARTLSAGISMTDNCQK